MKTSRLITAVLLASLFFVLVPGLAAAVQFENPLNIANYNDPGFVVEAIFINIRNFLLGIASAIVMATFIWGGIMYVLSLGDESRSARAKQIILYAIIGLLIMLTAKIIFDTVQCIAYPETCPAAPSIASKIYLFIYLVLLAPVGAVAFGALVFGGYLYLTSGGDESRASRAKQTITYALLGLGVIGISGIVINVIINFIT